MINYVIMIRQMWRMYTINYVIMIRQMWRIYTINYVLPQDISFAQLFEMGRVSFQAIRYALEPPGFAVTLRKGCCVEFALR